MTFKEIFNLPAGKTSRHVALLCLHELGQSATRKADTILECNRELSPDEQLMVKWFQELADQASRSIEQVHMHSQDNTQLTTQIS